MLTNIDEEKKQADCSLCGPGSYIDFRKKRYWQCGVKKQLSPEAKARKTRKDRTRLRGITPEQYDEVAEQQGNRCAICGGAQIADRSLAIDHCHKTDRFRGLLCNNCNVGLGMFQDDPDLLRAAIEYLAHA